MRTSLILLFALGLSTATNAQTTLLAASTVGSSTAPTAAALPDPGNRPEASTLITQVMEAEMKQPKVERKSPKLVYIDVKGEAATVRVDFGRRVLTGKTFYHLALVDGQWTIKGHDDNPQVK